MGTLGNGTYNDLKPSVNTTESFVNIQRFLKKMLKKHIKIIAMEISSHGIAQNRISKLYFSIAILTNITSDHLDYHINLENYIQAKWKFFSQNRIQTFIINTDDNIGRTWIKKLPKNNVIIVSTHQTFNFSSFKKWIFAHHIIYKKSQTDIYFKSSWGEGVLNSKLFGRFNVINLLLALATLLELGYPISYLIKTCNKIQAIYGRMQLFKVPNKPSIIIDYAHNEDAFRNVLKTIREIYYHNKIWCVFGCGGDRDKSKRSLMGAVAETIADNIILTNDNPRNENQKQIIEDILEKCTYKKNIYIILNRKNAITFAVTHANIDDCIAILGKGHEKYQIIKNKRYHFSDHEVIKKLLE